MQTMITLQNFKSMFKHFLKDSRKLVSKRLNIRASQFIPALKKDFSYILF